MKYLLDVNALIAAIWKNHPDHTKADAWVEGKELATCPLSQLGFLRVSTNPKALNSDMATARQLLEAFLRKHRSQFVADDLAPLKSSAQKSEQVTDRYLAELAATKGMKLATLDQGIAHGAVEIMR
jgi:toxin-antitoxin system PIN domain toxin